MGEEVRGWLLELEDGDPYVRWKAIEALESIDLPAVPALILALGDGYSNVRRYAALALGKIAEKHPEYDLSLAVPALVVALGDGDSDVRGNVAFALVNIAEKHPEYEWSGAVPALVVALGDGNSTVRENAAGALGNIGLPAVPALVVALGDGDSDVRRHAAEALGNIGPRDYRDLNVLIAIGRELKKEKREFKQVMELYSKWVKALNEKVDRGFADKRFHVPKIGKPDGTERVLRVKRVGSHE